MTLALFTKFQYYIIIDKYKIFITKKETKILKHSIYVLIILSIITGPNNVSAQNLGDLNNKLKDIKNSISGQKEKEDAIRQERKALITDINSIQQKVVKVAKEVKEFERILSQIDNRIAKLSKNEQEILNQLSEEKNKTVETIAILQRLLTTPAGILITEPQRPTDVIQTAIMLNHIINYLDSHSEKLKSDLTKLQSIRKQINSEKKDLSVAKNKISREKDKINGLLNQKKSIEAKLNKQQQQTQKEIQKLISESKSIEDLIKKIKSQQGKYANIISDVDRNSQFAKMQGKMPLPANGKITTKFNEKNRLGLVSKGITIQTTNNAQVITPYDAAVLFAGVFKSGKITIILYHGNNYYTVLTGVNKTFVSEGSNVLSGEPIAEMGGKNTYLQVELRYKEKTIDPLLYFN